MRAPPAPRPFPRKRGVAVLLALLILLGLGYFALTNLGAIERLLRGIPDNGWVLEAIQADALHARGLDGDGVVLCIVDTGVDLSHRELAGARLLAWLDLIRGEAQPYDDHGHGTNMVGLVAAQDLLPGVAPRVSLVVVKAVDATGEGTASLLVQGIDFCMDPLGDGVPVHIISLSLGGTPRPPVEDALALRVRQATERGVLVIASVGNQGVTARDVQSPASETMAIAVGAVDRNLRIAPFSQPGDNRDRTDPHRKPEVVAPGVDLATTGRGGSYVRVMGTSAATALVSALLALVLQGAPALQAASSLEDVLALKGALMETARHLEGQAVPHDDRYGYGLIQGLALLEALGEA